MRTADTCRWPIEISFRIYKRGCRIEEIQLGTEDRLLPCLALYWIVAWRVHGLTMLGRTCPELACDVVFAAEEWRSVWRSSAGSQRRWRPRR